MSSSQFSPVYPVAHVHSYSSGKVLAHVAPFWQGIWWPHTSSSIRQRLPEKPSSHMHSPGTSQWPFSVVCEYTCTCVYVCVTIYTYSLIIILWQKSVNCDHSNIIPFPQGRLALYSETGCFHTGSKPLAFVAGLGHMTSWATNVGNVTRI